MDEPVSRARFVVESCPGPGEEVRLVRAELSHLRARRLAPGQAVVLVDGSGREAVARLSELSRTGARLIVETVSLREADAPAIEILVAGVRLERLSWIAEKATELGAARIVLVASAWTQAHRAGASVRERLARVVREAAKQSESVRWPSIDGPIAFEKAIGEARPGHRILLDFDGAPFPPRLSGPAAILVGPEGGWIDSERALAREAGWFATALPAGKLRAETAAVAALVLARAALAQGEGGRR